MISNTVKAHLSFLVVNIIYGVNYLIAKGLMPDKLAANALIFIRVTGGLLLFLFFKFFVAEKVKKKHFPRLLFCGLFGVAANQLTSMNGLSLTSPVDGAIIVTAIPVFTSIISYFLLKEPFVPQKMAGIAIGAIGAVLLIYLGNTDIGSGSFTGNLLFAINAVIFATYLVIVKPLMDIYQPVTVVSWVFGFGFLWMFPFCIQPILEADFKPFEYFDWFSLLFTIIGPTFLAFLLNMYALQFVKPTVAGSYIYVQPAVAMILVAMAAYFVSDSQYQGDITIGKLICCVLIFTGVYLIGSKPLLKKQKIDDLS